MYRDRIDLLNIHMCALNPVDASRYGLSNWSLAPLQRHEDMRQNPELTRALRTVFRDMGVQRAFAPNVAPASAAIVDTNDLSDRIELAEEVSLYRRKEIPADGVFLKSGEAFLMSAAGCPVIIATAGTQVIVAHGARDSLIDRGAVIGSPSRKHGSIVDAIVEAFENKGTATNEILLCMLLSIPTRAFEHRFDHPQYGAYNRTLFDYINRRWHGCTAHTTSESMFLDLESVFMEQARSLGVRQVWATYSLAHYPAFAHTRDGHSPHRRNLILVKHSN